MRHRLPAATLTVAAAIILTDNALSARDVCTASAQTPGTPAAAEIPRAQRGTKPLAPAHLVTAAARLREKHVASAVIGRTMAWDARVRSLLDVALEKFKGRSG